ncbi:hypothetical protein M3N55_10620 [Roseibaca sp. V10]|uniref:Uncharacterized protein n=1 Tax=Roseinatronobacter domitianus TaxID=2940293 RepID=A0ABT0M2W0_9RHOB|nr:hypothetical protein [Roseibaca domitiana]MCL1629186.1 hypothetical protein [Roseibaca domitiana]
MTQDYPPRSASLRAPLATEIFTMIPELAHDMSMRPQTDEPVAAFAGRLLQSDTPEEAITFTSQMFKRRVSLWWGHECLRQMDACLTTHDRKMMALVADWVAAPDDLNRSATEEAAAQASARSPGVWLAMATGWTGGSLAPSDGEPVPPPRFLTGRGVNAAVLSVLARGPHRARRATLETFVQMANDLI